MICESILHESSLSFVADHSNMICSVALCNGATMGDELEHPHERLAYARERAGYPGKADFAKAVGIHPTTYRAYETGQNAFAKLAPIFAKKLGVSVEWLMSGSDAPVSQIPKIEPRPIEPDLPKVVGASDGDGAITVRQVDLSYAMGDGANLDDYYEERGIQFDPNFLRTVSKAPAHCLFVARGDGDSMFPTLINDDQVLIDTTQRRLNLQDRLWACSIHGAGMIKRLRVIGENRVEVISDNPAVGNREVSAEELYIVGRVVWVGRRM